MSKIVIVVIGMINLRSNITLLKIASLLAPLLVLVLVWYPEFEHYYVPGGRISDSTIQNLRIMPDQHVLEEIVRMPLLETYINGLSIKDQADKLLAGELLLPGKPPAKVSLPFAKEDLDKNSFSWQLSFSGLSAVRILLEAYEKTAKERYFNLAKVMLLSWADYESKAWLPRGFLWNDHAVAARLPVLTQFWSLYRTHPDFNTKVARKILCFALRSAQMLVKPEHFTYATNHGVMQNLGLLHAAVAFPGLPGIREFQKIAFDRMQSQMKFYINDEGVVLEHSAGYQAHGVYFLGSALRYLSLLDQPIPPQWKAKYQKAKTFYADLIRPDNSIPVFGDTPRRYDARITYITSIVGEQILPLARGNSLIPQQAYSIFPAAGYAIFWSGLKNWQQANNIAQTVLLWSYYPGHGHKLADDMSVLLWADGQDWWTNIGYWPYGQEGRLQAVSWNGSNAPHIVGERAHIVRDTQLRYYGEKNDLYAIDLERTDAGGFKSRRQVFQAGKNIWLVLDSSRDTQDRIAEHLWTSLPEVQINPDSHTGGYWLVSPNSSSRMQTILLGSNDYTVQRLSGAKEPFAGWIVMDEGSIQKTNTFLVRRPSNMSWSLAVWKLVNKEDNAVISSRLEMNQWSDAENWSISIPMSSGEKVEFQRQGNSINLINISDIRTTQSLKLDTGPDVTGEISQTQQEFNILANQYEGHRDLTYYRARATYFVLLLLLFQETLFFIFRKKMMKNYLRPISVIAWLALGIWLNTFYFVS